MARPDGQRAALPRDELRAVPAAATPRQKLVGFLDRNVDRLHRHRRDPLRQAARGRDARCPSASGSCRARAGGRQEEQRSVRARHVGHAGDQHAPGGQEPGRDDHRAPPRRSRGRGDGAELHAALPAARHARHALEARVQDPARRPQDRGRLRAGARRDPAIGRGTVLQLEQVLTGCACRRSSRTSSPARRCSSTRTTSTASTRRCATRSSRPGCASGMLTGDTDDARPRRSSSTRTARVDVLIASSRIGTGVNGLQYVCNKLIINALPWTNAEYEQLVGRLFRQGSRFDKVDVIIPVTFAMVNGRAVVVLRERSCTGSSTRSRSPTRRSTASCPRATCARPRRRSRTSWTGCRASRPAR